MPKTVATLALLAAFIVFLALPTGCARSGFTGPPGTGTPVPAPLPVPQANMPAPEVPPAAAPNPGGIVQTSMVAAANLEASTMKTAAKAYLATHQGTLSFTSDELVSSYFSGTPKARYYFNGSTGSIVRVDSVPGGWTGIVFSLSRQKWVAGAPDNDHINDQDVP